MQPKQSQLNSKHKFTQINKYISIYAEGLQCANVGKIIPTILMIPHVVV